MTGVSATTHEFVKWFSEISIDDIPLVGGKNASLGEMYRELVPRGINVPDGYALTADAYRFFMKKNGLDQEIKTILQDLDTNDLHNLQERGRKVRHAILNAEMPVEIQEAITSAYRQLSQDQGGAVDVAVRSSATAEDLPDASFAGQQETYLNVETEPVLLEMCKRCFASLFTDRAISYREHKGFDHLKIALSIGIQRMVRSDLATAGVMFSIDTESGFKNAVLINAAYGLGENVVQGSVNPDEIYVFKPTLKEGYEPILQKKMGNKEMKLVYDVGGNRMTKNIPVPEVDRNRFCISDEEILTLARWACEIEDHYSGKRDQLTPMDMEWAKDGRTGELFIVQARPETVQSQKQANSLELFELKEKGKVLVTGRAVGERIGQGPVKLIKKASMLDQFEEGDVLVTDRTDPDWEPTMKKASAIVTNRGGRTCHAAIVSRELGLPSIVGTVNATDILKNGQQVTVSCAEGDEGKVYEGLLEFETTEVNLEEHQKTRTKIMMNLANPEKAFHYSFLPNDGVGLAREEFMISNYVKIHPRALIEYDHLEDSSARHEIDLLTEGYEKKVDYFVDRLAEGVAMISAAFYPNDVILRFSDFKTNEYANLIGGQEFEPVENNPMIGFRGASRYYDERYAAAFALECEAVKKVRDQMGLVNLKVMVPFCRTVEEGEKVLAEMKKNGLVQGENGLEVYVMCEIPSNVIIADEFARIFDGFSIGSNDLTQLVLGVDRDSELVARLFDERNPAVMKMISKVIKTAKANNCKIGICGQAPSDYPDFARFLVSEGIDSISLTPDSILKTTLAIREAENQ